MKEINKKTKIILLLVTIIIIAGAIVTMTIGLNFDLKYQETNKIQLYLGKEFKVSDIKKITDEILENKEVIIQKVEVYEDSVSIIAKEITDEQKTNLINKINENYETDLSADEIKITNIPHTRARDIIRPCVMPFIIATTIILAYMAIRYYKLGAIKTILKTGFLLVIAQAVLLSVMAITRIPIGRMTIPLVLIVYMVSLLGGINNFEKKLKEEKIKENKKNEE